MAWEKDLEESFGSELARLANNIMGCTELVTNNEADALQKIQFTVNRNRAK